MAGAAIAALFFCGVICGTICVAVCGRVRADVFDGYGEMGLAQAVRELGVVAGGPNG